MKINCTTYHDLWASLLQLQNRCRSCLLMALNYGNILTNHTGYTPLNKSLIVIHELGWMQKAVITAIRIPAFAWRV